MIFPSRLSRTTTSPSGLPLARGAAPSAYATSGRSRWKAPVGTVALWALAAASVVFWVLRLSAPADAVAPPAALTRPEVTADPAAIARLLGVVPAAAVATPEAASRFVLWGVIVDGANRGAALISVDGQPPRPWRVGAQLVDGYVLQAISRRAAKVGGSVDSAPAFTLQMAVRAPLSLSGVSNAPGGSAVVLQPAPGWIASPPIALAPPPVMAPPPGGVNSVEPMLVQQGSLPAATPSQ